MLFWFSVRAATSSVAHALHTFGGYGLSNEYDIQLYHRRAKTSGLLLGDPLQELRRAGRRLFLGEQTVLPHPGLVDVAFYPPERVEPLPADPRASFERLLHPAQPHTLKPHPSTPS